MEQLLVTIEDKSMASSLKKAILLLKGVTEIKRYTPNVSARKKTLKAITDYKNGDVVECSDFEDYLKKTR